MEPRWYQKEAVDKTIKYLKNKNKENPLIVCPTGSGKTIILSLITKHLVDTFQAKILVVSHNEQIIKQDYKALIRIIPSEIVGVYSAGLKKKQRKTITVASIQSIYRKCELFNNYEYIIIDEAHTVPHSNDGMYRKFIAGIGEPRVIGLTATPFRTGTGMLVDGDKAIFSSVVFDVPIVRLIKEGYLCGLKTMGTDNQMDVKGIKTVAGDYSTKDLSKKLDREGVTNSICSELVRYKKDYKSWLVFAIDINHANRINKELNDIGITSTVIHSKLDKHVSNNNLDTFMDCKFQAAVSVAKLTTGFDHPRIDLIALLRPTKSPVLHVQTIGRGLRIHPDKKHCLILDFAGNIMRLGPINDVHIPIKGKKGNKEAPVKLCPGCNSHVPASARSCYYCGHTFPEPKTTLLELKATNLSAIKDTIEQLPVGWFPVSKVVYEPYISMKKIPSMRVTYFLSKNSKVHEYINPFAKTRKGFNDLNWLQFRLGYKPYVENVKDMLALVPKLSKPAALNVDFTGKYPRILDATFR